MEQTHLLNGDLKRIAALPGLKLTNLTFQDPELLEGVVEDGRRKFIVEAFHSNQWSQRGINMPFDIWGVDVSAVKAREKKRSFGRSKPSDFFREPLLTVRLDPRDGTFGVKVMEGSNPHTLWECVIKFALQGQERQEWEAYENMRSSLAEGIPYFTWMPLKEVKQIFQ